MSFWIYKKCRNHATYMCHTNPGNINQSHDDLISEFHYTLFIILLCKPTVHIIKLLSQHASTVFSVKCNMHGHLILVCVCARPSGASCFIGSRPDAFMLFLLLSVYLKINLENWTWNGICYPSVLTVVMILCNAWNHRPSICLQVQFIYQI